VLRISDNFILMLLPDYSPEVNPAVTWRQS
jgi:hypothetical protein